jgi:phosphatidate cytidylyltransferase
MSEIYKRTITGIAIVGVVVCSLMLGRYTFFALCCVIDLLGLFEFYRLTAVAKRLLRIAGMILSACLLLTVFLYTNCQFDWKILILNLPLVSSLFATTLFLKPGNPFQDLAFIFLGQIYITLSLILLYRCAFALDENLFSTNVILGYFFFLWANDTGAYVCGSIFGKNKLAPVISPNKTWEGSAGGAFLVVVFVYVNYYFFKDLSLANWMVLGIVVIVMGTVGDLTKSVLKRTRDVKDSGSILPGHGGILDRFDSLIGSVPSVFAYLSILN